MDQILSEALELLQGEAELADDLVEGLLLGPSPIQV
jgi:hypothetical protein